MTQPRPLRAVFDPNGKKRYFYLAFTLAFTAVALAVFSWHIRMGKSLIQSGDGWQQHYKALLYYGRYLRRIVKTLFAQGKLVIPEWDFYISEGNDILQTLHYYALGDPIALLSALVPTRFMPQFYAFACVLRMYLAGLSFSVLAFGMGKRNRYAVLAGMLAYSFCFWAIRGAARHPFFVNPMIYFPLIILGVERVIAGRRPGLFVFSVALAGMASFYFFYMIALLTVVYVLVRLAFVYGRNIKKALGALARIAALAVLAACIAAIVLLPIIFAYLQDSRLAMDQPFRLFYGLGYYFRLPAILVSNGLSRWLVMGFSAPVVISLFALFIKKGNRFLKTLAGICFAFILFPAFGSLFNGMAYAVNRWCWAFALLCCFILTWTWEDVAALSRREWLKALACCAAFFLLCLALEEARKPNVFSTIPLFAATLALMRWRPDKPRGAALRQLAVVAIVPVSAVLLSYWVFSPSVTNAISDYKDAASISDELSNSDAIAVRNVSKETYPRFCGRLLQRNTNMIDRVSSTQYYWSITNASLNGFRRDLEVYSETALFHIINNYNERTAITTLSSVQYYVTRSKGKNLPYGYRLVKNNTSDRFIIYKNRCALPLGYGYGAVISPDQWDAMNAVQRQQAQLEAAYVEGGADGLPQLAALPEDGGVPYEMALGDNVIQTETGFVTTANNATIKLTFKGAENAETYVRLGGFDFTGATTYDLYLGDGAFDPLDEFPRADWDALPLARRAEIVRAKLYDTPVDTAKVKLKASNGLRKEFHYTGPGDIASSGRNDFIVNLGYSKKAAKSVTLTLHSRGVYTLSDLRVYCVPMAGYAKKVRALGETALENLALGDDTLSGTVTADTDKWLCVAVPYSIGWRATVDGADTPVRRTNDRYLGIAVPAGKHEIVFTYRRPFQRLGAALTAAGLLAALAIILVEERKRQRKA